MALADVPDTPGTRSLLDLDPPGSWPTEGVEYAATMLNACGYVWSRPSGHPRAGSYVCTRAVHTSPWHLSADDDGTVLDGRFQRSHTPLAGALLRRTLRLPSYATDEDVAREIVGLRMVGDTVPTLRHRPVDYDPNRTPSP